MGEPNRFRLDAPERKTGETGRRSEARVAKSLAAQLTAGSGNQRASKGDARMNRAAMRALIESKSTVRNSIGLEYGWLAKIASEALAAGRTPVLTVSFTTPDGAARADGDWAMIPMHVFKELVE